ncbi:STAS domain-containing protein [Saccharopolyspora spinosa]|uniref:RsbT co-antagonist protein RsbR n=1 Tax=Saccharopolyspora spinosa TaxID=60894 RepID=A0A2N3Y5R1_SACSN|nr:STAS domain-containing protein [Saccharopolyspora spinosa]PKW18181.1 rsbT co-antagonist protein RsbR [Saccharopolyspora spinosa]
MSVVTNDEVRRELVEFLDQRQPDVVREWSLLRTFAEQRTVDAVGGCTELLNSLRRAARDGQEQNPAAAGFDDVRPMLRASAGGGASRRLDLLSLKEPLLRLWWEHRAGTPAVTDGALALSSAVDALRMVQLEEELTAGTETISMQRQQLTELSTPVIKLWDGVLAVPLIGTLDSTRSQSATESLLEQVVVQQAKVAILDITGVPTVDTMVAQHLLKTTMAARLMGVECVLSGIRPQIAQTMVQLGIDLGDLVTKASLADALSYALQKTGLAVVSADQG